MVRQGYTTKRILITVKTYPNASRSYEETVCTAGITEDGRWIRLYPVNFRRLDKEYQYSKYQWVEVDVISRMNTNDKRPESYKPDLESLKLLATIGTKDGWRERREILKPLPIRTLNECKLAYHKDMTSLSIVDPGEILDFIWTPNDEEPKWTDEFSEQMDLFGQKQLKLERLPYKFQYIFRCRDSSKESQIAVIDWELGVLFLKMRREKETERAALEAVREKYFTEMCDSSRDTLFFMGTILPFNTWVVIGVFWPPKQAQGELF